MEKVIQPLRVLITGGFGYIGGRVAQYLTEQGHQVILGSRTKQSPPVWLPQSEVVKLDWNDEDALTELCKGVDVIIHSAGMNAHDCAADPVAALEFNGLATARLVRSSKKAGVTKFIYLSTAHVYRAPLIGEIDENTCPQNLHPYATSHLAGENVVLYNPESESDSHFTGIVLRLSNVIGAPTHKEVNCWMLVVNDLCQQVVKNKKIKISSAKNTERDFISVSSVCRVICEVIAGKGKNNKVDGEIFNLCSGSTISLEVLSSIIAKRSEFTLGYIPSIEFCNNSNVTIDNPLLISNEKALNAELKLDSNIEHEIDELLLNCQKWFGTKK